MLVLVGAIRLRICDGAFMRLLKITTATQQMKSGSNLQEEAELRRAIRSTRRTFSAEHPNVALAHLQLGDYFYHEQRYEEAESAYRNASEIYERLGAGHELLLAIALRSLAQAVCAQDRHDEGNVFSAKAHGLIVNFQ